MDIPINAAVVCEDGSCGRSVYVILNPTTEEVTHIVVKLKQYPHNEYLVPIDVVAETSAEVIRLRCTSQAIEGMPPFIETEFVPSDIPEYAGGGYMTWPHLLEDLAPLPVERELIPEGELALRRGARVEATDGHVGQVDELVVDPNTGAITHVVLREGHLWGRREVSIPVSEIDRIEEGVVYLKLNRRRIEALPSVPAQRR